MHVQQTYSVSAIAAAESAAAFAVAPMNMSKIQDNMCTIYYRFRMRPQFISNSIKEIGFRNKSNHCYQFQHNQQ